MEKPQNNQFWQEIAKHTEAVQKSFWYAAQDLAKHLDDQPKLYSSYIQYDVKQPDPSWSWWTKLFFYYGQGEYNKSVTQHNMVVSLSEKSSWIYGMLQGDFNKDPTLSQVVVGGIISLIPVVDQVCDIRDLISNLITLSDEGQRNTENFMALALTSIGLIPEVGSLFKTVIKSTQVKGATKISLIKTMESLETITAKVGIHCPWGRAPQRWLQNDPWKQLATNAQMVLRKNIDRLSHVLNTLISKTIGPLRAKIQSFYIEISKIVSATEKYIKELCEEISRKVKELLQVPHQPLAMAGHSHSGPKPTNRYETNTAGSQPTHAQHQQKETKPPDKDKKNKNDKEPSCILRPYKPDTCKPLGKTGHHVVPDRCFRLGARKGAERGGIDGGLTEAEGLVICVEGATPKPSNQHGQIHEQHDVFERELKGLFKPMGTAALIEVEVACAKSVALVLKKCSAASLATQLRSYHQSKGMGPDFIVRVDNKGYDARKIDVKEFGHKKRGSGY
ncbi:hypothetical protein [Acinetobacter boissieri]|uniref:GHH signature containing HNH/Endo VII superfamily nuclease toxin 2 n=1 Tax=Acinetobacter boissieri TaxID=1219383 RepID=A0A1G6GYJ8_9GAMM|nr:hypothetical protein [Acinetobacter boissieri]SDB86755.1 GHH signature containing HNH/Endo VII superfamily nuclease toxin 2 [Acinetobacter boissieri]